jgi:hypothetical protein
MGGVEAVDPQPPYAHGIKAVRLTRNNSFCIRASLPSAFQNLFLGLGDVTTGTSIPMIVRATSKTAIRS